MTQPFRWRMRVRYNEIDAQALVYFAQHLTYYDNAITEFFRWLPFDLFGYARASGFDFNIVHAEIDFTRSRPARRRARCRGQDFAAGEYERDFCSDPAPG